MAVENEDPFYALHNVSGFVRSGEMVLVLGANESTTSTLIRSLTAQLSSKDNLSGSLLLNGLPLGPDAWQWWRRIASYVSSSDTTYAAVLTVRETLFFAAQCNSDGTQSDKELNEIVEEVLEFLDIAHVASTVVGDENLRGISGGQKRRVMVGEMLMNAKTSFLGLENITDSLSSQDSFNLIQRLNIVCKAFRYSSVVSLLQPSDEIVALFDKILVLSESGQLEYFGPVDRPLLREVFLGPDTDPKLDTGSICDLVLSQSILASNVQQVEIQKRFNASSAGEELTRSLAEIRTSASALTDRNIHALLPQDKYASEWHAQFRYIANRRLKLIARNAVTYTRIGIVSVFCCIIGSLFGNLNYDLVGSLSRTGFLFLNCFLILMLSSAITIPQTF